MRMHGVCIAAALRPRSVRARISAIASRLGPKIVFRTRLHRVCSASLRVCNANEERSIAIALRSRSGRGAAERRPPGASIASGLSGGASIASGLRA